MYTIAIVGAGLIGPRHAHSVLSNPSTSLVALVDPSPAARSTAKDLEDTPYFESVQAMLLAGVRPDGAIVCTPNHTHVPLAQELLEANIHVLLEKPISDTVESAKRLLEMVTLRQNDPTAARVLVGHHRRFNPYVVKTKQLLDAKSLGSVIAVNGLWTLYKPASYFDSGVWRKGPAGGVLGINLIHDVDVLQFLFGKISRVHAEGIPSQRGADHSADEGALVLFRFESGVVASFLVCDATPSPYNFESGTGENPTIPANSQPGTQGKQRVDFYRIFGSDASLSVPDMTRWSYTGEKSWNEPLLAENIAVEESVPFDAQLKHFVDVMNGHQPSCSVEDGLRALTVVQAVKKALEGEIVDVDGVY
ncbi:hypothetical protein ASPZODRAFT_128302 [Penicilliopsis zonata CBS 506.65]|uniref:Gfo/Idh/MocA-like oxidoreductase N-terminal domain-containing protein n=1 Tax=Penicilliopsis zonata CBS 506.65 TaxID=1073090 RepID=A0A1L9SRP7_9EURO|nr:hypothetical protein ASPZODRAFT_128302 [Penicilliopsis zonata CBS 506.65]OJJ49773.1 hypothetical protein ASPZODRAFT_128302 [Penicilliopsis zonata CBS 506.65]